MLLLLLGAVISVRRTSVGKGSELMVELMLLELSHLSMPNEDDEDDEEVIKSDAKPIPSRSCLCQLLFIIIMKVCCFLSCVPL